MVLSREAYYPAVQIMGAAAAAEAIAAAVAAAITGSGSSSSSSSGGSSSGGNGTYVPRSCELQSCLVRYGQLGISFNIN